MPAVSVIIPCYNLGQYLAEAVHSVLAQTLQDFEILIVDDGSTDEITRGVLDDFARPNTQIIRSTHVGLAAARNIGIARATGRYLCALDADDRLLPVFLERTIGVLDSRSDLTFCSAWLRTFGDEDWKWTPARCDLPTLLWEDTVLTAALVRRDAVVRLGGYDTGMPEQGDEDWDLWLRLVAGGHKGTILPEVLFEYRRRAGSMSTICWYGAGHMPLLRYRVNKFRELYEKHLWDVLLHQDGATAALLRRNEEMERHLSSFLEPALALREAELQRLEEKLARVQPNAAELAQALAATTAEVAAFKNSMSWRVTAPLRTAYGWWLKRTNA